MKETKLINIILIGLLTLIPSTIFIPSYAINSIVIISAVFLTLLKHFFYREQQIKIKDRYLLCLIVVYSLFLLIFLAISDDIDSGLFVLQKKIPILVLPFVVYFNRKLVAKNIRVIFLTFILAIFLGGLWCQYSIILDWRESGKSLAELFAYHRFTSSYFSEKINLHPSYFANMLLLAILIIYSLLFKVKQTTFKMVLFLLWGYFSFLIMILAVRIHILSYLIFLGWLIIAEFFKSNKKGYFNKIAISIIGIVVIIFLFKLDFLQSRFHQGIDMYFNEGKNYPSYYESSRVHVWKHFPSEFMNSPFFGAGTGNENNMLYGRYVLDNYERGKQQRLNYHNQYFQELARSGIIGFFVFGFICYLLFKKSIKLKSPIFIWFLVFNFIFLVVESVFERHHGIVFFFYFSALFYYSLEKSDDYLNSQKP